MNQVAHGPLDAGFVQDLGRYPMVQSTRCLFRPRSERGEHLLARLPRGHPVDITQSIVQLLEVVDVVEERDTG